MAAAYKPEFWTIQPLFPDGARSDDFLGRIVQSDYDLEGAFTPKGKPIDLIDAGLVQLGRAGEVKVQDGYQPLQDVEGTLKSRSETKVLGTFTQLLSMRHQQDKIKSIDYKASKIRMKRLSDHPLAFEALIKDRQVQTDLDKYLKNGGKALMIVGLLIWEDAEITFEQENSKEDSIKGKMPVDAAMGGARLPPPGNATNVEVEASQTTAEESVLRAKVPGLSVFALEFRVIKRNFMGFGTKKQLGGGLARRGGIKFGDKEGNDEEKDEDAPLPFRITNESAEASLSSTWAPNQVTNS